MHFQKLGLFLNEWAYFLDQTRGCVRRVNVRKTIKSQLPFVRCNIFLPVFKCKNLRTNSEEVCNFYLPWQNFVRAFQSDFMKPVVCLVQKILYNLLSMQNI